MGVLLYCHHIVVLSCVEAVKLMPNKSSPLIKYIDTCFLGNSVRLHPTLNDQATDSLNARRKHNTTSQHRWHPPRRPKPINRPTKPLRMPARITPVGYVHPIHPSILRNVIDRLIAPLQALKKLDGMSIARWLHVCS